MKTPEIIFGVVKEEMRPPLAPIDQLLEKAKEANDRVAYQALDEVALLLSTYPFPHIHLFCLMAFVLLFYHAQCSISSGSTR